MFSLGTAIDVYFMNIYCKFRYNQTNSMQVIQRVSGSSVTFVTRFPHSTLPASACRLPVCITISYSYSYSFFINIQSATLFNRWFVQMFSMSRSVTSRCALSAAFAILVPSRWQTLFICILITTKHAMLCPALRLLLPLLVLVIVARVPARLIVSRES